MLNLCEGLKKYQESDDYDAFWYSNDKAVEDLNSIVKNAISYFETKKSSVSFGEFYAAEKSNLSFDKKAVEACIEISKTIQKNNEGKLGLKDWVEINPKGIKDKAYLVFKKLNKSLHFSEVAERIQDLFVSSKKAHVATVHNELIKDPRFVLVGRGLYALKEWGYEPGVVKDVIINILKNEGPLAKDELIQKVLKQRMVKENTVFLNLQNKNYFTKDSKGKYTVKEA